jgi:hypothetical protein
MTMETLFPNAAVCPSCASPARAGETFCGVCGARVAPAPVAAVATLPSAIVPQPDTLVAKRKNPPRSIVAIAGAVAVVITVALLGINDAGAHSRLSTTRGKLASTQSTLTSTKADLDSVEHQLTSTKADLESAESARIRVHDQLVATQRDLAGVRGNLSDTQNQLNLQAGQFEIVKTCLSGVATAFSADLDGDYSSALAALNSVESACDQAFSYFD